MKKINQNVLNNCFSQLSTLTLLDTMVSHYSSSLSPDSLSPVLAELPPLVSESDLHIAQLTLSLLTSISNNHRHVSNIYNSNASISKQ